MRKASVGYSKKDKVIDEALAAAAKTIKSKLESAKDELDPKEDKELINYIDNILEDINLSINKFGKIKELNKLLELV
ncbi:MAG: hypothetical protein AWU54_1943 [Candidatus Frackibacter sp. T328-2]|nr:MAG: hypothetical protein AWU54_1943 [Candidatus Frackibacter sp. T328-2]